MGCSKPLKYVTILISHVFQHFYLQLTWADLYFAAILDYLNYLTKTELVSPYENLRKVVDNVNSIESIKKWIDNRPKTDI